MFRIGSAEKIKQFYGQYTVSTNIATVEIIKQEMLRYACEHFLTCVSHSKINNNFHKTQGDYRKTNAPTVAGEDCNY